MDASAGCGLPPALINLPTDFWGDENEHSYTLSGRREYTRYPTKWQEAYPKEFDDILRKAGNHERSRVLTLLRNDWGIPVEQFKTEAYHVTERNLEAYHSDKDETLKIWRTNARYVKTLRKVNITLSLLRGLVGKVPEDTLRTVYKGIETKYL